MGAPNVWLRRSRVNNSTGGPDPTLGASVSVLSTCTRPIKFICRQYRLRWRAGDWLGFRKLFRAGSAAGSSGTILSRLQTPGGLKRPRKSHRASKWSRLFLNCFFEAIRRRENLSAGQVNTTSIVFDSRIRSYRYFDSQSGRGWKSCRSIRAGICCRPNGYGNRRASPNDD